MAQNPTAQTLSELRRSIADVFSIEEFRTLCADLGVNYDNLGGEGLEVKARELITYLQHRDRLPELISACAAARPNRAWPQAGGRIQRA